MKVMHELSKRDNHSSATRGQWYQGSAISTDVPYLFLPHSSCSCGIPSFRKRSERMGHPALTTNSIGLADPHGKLWRSS